MIVRSIPPVEEMYHIDMIGKESLDIYDELPEDMINYLRYNGRHFNRKLCDYAVNLMTDKNNNHISALAKDDVDKKLHLYGVTLENNVLYDYVYLANQCKADFLGSSIPDDAHLCYYIRDVLDDADGYDGLPFNRWYADMCRKGEPIDWYSVL